MLDNININNPLMTPRGKGPRNQQTNQPQALILLSCYCYLIKLMYVSVIVMSTDLAQGLC